jgi:hypothetical protein
MRKHRIARAVFSAMFVGALGFGAAHALARPAVSAPPGCDKFECIEWCAQYGKKGVCVSGGDGYYYCQCY